MCYKLPGGWMEAWQSQSALAFSGSMLLLGIGSVEGGNPKVDLWLRELG